MFGVALSEGFAPQQDRFIQVVYFNHGEAQTDLEQFLLRSKRQPLLTSTANNPRPLARAESASYLASSAAQYTGN